MHLFNLGMQKMRRRSVQDRVTGPYSPVKTGLERTLEASSVF